MGPQHMSRDHEKEKEERIIYSFGMKIAAQCEILALCGRVFGSFYIVPLAVFFEDYSVGRRNFFAFSATFMAAS